MPTTNLCNELLKQYQCQTKSPSAVPAQRANGQPASEGQTISISTTSPPSSATLDEAYLVAKKRRVVKFLRCWLLITREHFLRQQPIQAFLSVSLGFLATKARPRSACLAR